MPRLHKEILTEEQVNLLPLVRRFSKKFFLVGGTAMALHIGHRRSMDFDLFSSKGFRNTKIKRTISRMKKVERVFKDEGGQYTISIGGIRFTFFQYPFAISAPKRLDGVITLPDMLTLAAMKAYALGHRAKWKDYVDLYFVMKENHGPDEIIKRAKHIFGREFNERIFRVQLAYFRDIDYTERVIYLKGFETKDAVIKRALTDFSLQ
ncbi:MAG: hypothetical protein A3C07_00815 [Candidatus Sungbacteria bacterium RIFCSPHIGHO2_02_FULL_47_11]|uniref:Nucleotidyl transferase AbiEii/AbiGii toxin family protein n=1 Tax=Candidatus Sungbacteria bacterium RIFCSPHIGHO2_02_FULL_47_11 TaxID=1802270 RepID=A0A1G2KQQ6_9BACT|nr:MAG: hypothetical protein A3C07_00815 [Candidatus Sungbacteria bacterium RIFCSPHIGHO2_02_FULL_47_11]